MKRLYSFLLMLLLSTTAYSQEKVQGIIVELASGERVTYKLADHPRITYDGHIVNLSSNGASVEYSPSELVKISMGEVPNVDSSIKKPSSAPSGDVRIDEGFIHLSGFKAGEHVGVYSVNGVMRSAFCTSSDGTLVIPLSSMPTGVSVIKINKQSIKITKS